MVTIYWGQHAAQAMPEDHTGSKDRDKVEVLLRIMEKQIHVVVSKLILALDSSQTTNTTDKH